MVQPHSPNTRPGFDLDARHLIVDDQPVRRRLTGQVQALLPKISVHASP